MLAFMRLLRIFTRKVSAAVPALPGKGGWKPAHIYMSWQRSWESMIISSTVGPMVKQGFDCKVIPFLHRQVMLPCDARCTQTLRGIVGKGVLKGSYLTPTRETYQIHSSSDSRPSPFFGGQKNLTVWNLQVQKLLRQIYRRSVEVEKPTLVIRNGRSKRKPKCFVSMARNGRFPSFFSAVKEKRDKPVIKYRKKKKTGYIWMFPKIVGFPPKSSMD